MSNTYEPDLFSESKSFMHCTGQPMQYIPLFSFCIALIISD